LKSAAAAGGCSNLLSGRDQRILSTSAAAAACSLKRPHS